MVASLHGRTSLSSRCMDGMGAFVGGAASWIPGRRIMQVVEAFMSTTAPVPDEVPTQPSLRATLLRTQQLAPGRPPSWSGKRLCDKSSFAAQEVVLFGVRIAGWPRCDDGGVSLFLQNASPDAPSVRNMRRGHGLMAAHGKAMRVPVKPIET